MRLSRGSRWFLAFGLILVAGVVAGVWYLDTAVLDDGVEPGQPVEYTVQRGASVTRVGDDLADLGVVRSSFRFRSAAGEAGLAETLQPGVFELETGMGVDEAIRVLDAGPVAPPTIRFTVPEGLTVAQTLERLAEQFPAHEVEDFRAILDARRDVDLEDEEVSAELALSGLLEVPEWVPEPSQVTPDLEPFEGLLWPETYEVLDTASAQEVLQRMIDQLDVELAAVPEDLREGVPDEQLYDNLIFASLIERETRVDDERALLAGVIQNRLDQNWRLQIDATVVYALGGGPRDVVTFEDLEIEAVLLSLIHI